MASKIVREWVKGKFPAGFEVLDIGAGTSPAPGTTRAVDSNHNLLTKRGKLKKKVCIPGSLIEYANYDARSLPYDDSFFDRGISCWAIGARIKGIKVIRELYRVLKPGGEIYIAILEEDKETIPVTRKNLRRAGFKILETYTGKYSESRNGGQTTVEAMESIIHGIKG